jgi:quercetin dioxygenase-like cupin family protein
MASPESAASYRWADVPADHPMRLLERRRIIGRRVMVAEVRLQKGCVVPAHVHDNEQFCCVLSGRLRFGLGAEGSPQYRQIEVAAGETVHLPSGVVHSAEAVEQTVVIDIFSPPSEKTGIDK